MRFPSPFRRAEKKKVPPQPLAGRLINAAAILLFAFFVVHQSRHRAPEPPPTPEHAHDPLGVYYIEAAQQQALSLILRLGAQSTSSWSELRPGADPVAQCGRMVNAELALLEAASDEPIKGLPLPKALHWRLGLPDAPMEALLQPLVLGLGTGGMREQSLPLSLIQGVLAPKQITERGTERDRLVRLRATLIKTEAPPQSPQPLIVLESATGDRDRRAACGQIVTLAVRLWSPAGEPLHAMDDHPEIPTAAAMPGAEARRVVARLGGGMLPYGIERAVEGMGIGATRIAMVGPDWQAPIGPASAAPDSPEARLAFRFPTEKQTPIAQITLIAVDDTLDQALAPLAEELSKEHALSREHAPERTSKRTSEPATSSSPEPTPQP